MMMMRGSVIGWKVRIQVSQIAAKPVPTPPVPDDGHLSDELPALRHIHMAGGFESGLTWAKDRVLLLSTTDDLHSERDRGVGFLPCTRHAEDGQGASGESEVDHVHNPVHGRQQLSLFHTLQRHLPLPERGSRSRGHRQVRDCESAKSRVRPRGAAPSLASAQPWAPRRMGRRVLAGWVATQGSA